jgi:predicted transcriptional regulator
MTKRAFGELESEILYILKSGTRKTVKEVHKELGGQDNYNTVMTVMSRLANKNKLAREKNGLQYEYWIVDPSTSYTFFEKVREKFFGAKTSVIVSHLIESADDLTDQDLDEMEKLLNKRRSSNK